MRHLLAGGAAALALAAAAGAQAAPVCDKAALDALAIADVAITSARPVAATAQLAPHCLVEGVVRTTGKGAPDGQARFLIQLPETWRQRFLFVGSGGNAGTLSPSANPVDRTTALAKGYAVVVTDTGHLGDGTSADWVRTPDGAIDVPKVADFFGRAVHSVTVAGKALSRSYYGLPVQHAYFDGCSTGGRMALDAAVQYPEDFAGVISGDPALDYRLNLARIATQRMLLAKPGRYISTPLLTAIDARITAQCDAIDGAKDGVVQDPGRCTVKPAQLVCKAGETFACLTTDQAEMLAAYFAPLRNRRGEAIYPGWPAAHLVGPQGANYYVFGQTPGDAAAANPWGADDRQAPRGWRMGQEALTQWLGYGPAADIRTADADPNSKTVGDDLIARTGRVMSPAEVITPEALKPFFARGGKMIFYHGASDPSIPAERTVGFYEALTTTLGGPAKAQSQARLFLVPGMQHCGNGAGPDRFDTLSALEAWVEQGRAPAVIIARTRPENPAPRSLPLCPYPQQARYTGSGDLAQDRNWRCDAAALKT